MKRDAMRRSWIVAVVCAVGGVAIAAWQAGAQTSEGPDEFSAALEELQKAASGDVKVTRSAKTGLATFMAVRSGGSIEVSGAAGATPKSRALSFLGTHGRLFGIQVASQLQEIRTRAQDLVAMDHVRFRQVHQGVPVTGAELTVHLRGAAVVAANGKALRLRGDLATVPTIGPGAAQAAALAVLKKHLKIESAELSEPRLEIFDLGFIGGPHRPTRLAWFVEARRTDLRQFVWVDALDGSVIKHFSQLPHALNRRVYTANNTAALPGSLVRNEGQGPAADSDVNDAYDFSGDTYDNFFSEHGRDSYDDAGAQLRSTVRYCPSPSDCPYQNAFWNGVQMVYGAGFPAADDVDAHELTHAVTEHSAGLFYYMQSGALNESFSDIFGETVDLGNGAGNDTPGVRWKMGEDVPVFGAIRDMSDPTVFGDPGKMSDPQFDCLDSGEDAGGVHGNSGVPNHAYFLMVDGGTYNGITVAPIGLTKAGKIQYRSLTEYLTSASDFLDNYDALNQSCSDLIGVAGITGADCVEVQKALDAVEMAEVWGGPTTPCVPAQPVEAATCPVGQGPVNVFFDDLENRASGKWTTGVLSGLNHWTGGSGSPAIYFSDFATSPLYHFWGFNYGVTADSTANMKQSFALPANAHMQFNHSFGFENSGTTYWDGSVLEYSTNNGVSWLDAGSLISPGADYNGVITNLDTNPLAGRNAFVGESWGYTSTHLDLSSLAGQSVRFRFRIGTDSTVQDYGWFVDDVRIYTCDVGGSVQLGAPTYTIGEAGPAVSVTVTRTGGLAGGVSVDYATSNVSAEDGSDYTGMSGSLSFGPGVTTQTILFPILNDTLDEPDETFEVELLGVSGPTVTLGAQSLATVTIADNDVAGSIEFSSTALSVSEAGPQATVSVKRTGGSAGGATVQYATSNGSATAGSDYTTRTGTLTFNAGVTSQSFTVPITNDAVDEPNETVNLTLSAPGGGATLGVKTSAVLSITDNDVAGAIQFSLAAQSIAEGGGSALVTVTRGGGTAIASVDYATSDGTASAGSDYTGGGATLSFGAGVTSRTFLVPISQDTLGENNETVILRLSNPTGGATLGARSTNTLTILEDESVLQFSAAQFNVGEATPNATITVKRSGATTGTTTVGYDVSDGSAVAGSDYTAIAPGTLVFAPKVLTKTFTVPILNDALSEPTESFVVSLASAVGGVFGPQATSAVVVTDDDSVLSFKAATFAAKEGTATVVITVTRTGNKTLPVNVQYATSNGSADGSDYGATNGTLAFAAGVASKTFSVSINDVSDPEGPESLNLTLSNPSPASDARLGLASAAIDIADNEPVLAFGAAAYSVSENAASVTTTVKRTGSTTQTVSVTCAPSGGSATQGSDYQAPSPALLSFGPGVKSRPCVVPILPDALAEPAETVNLSLTGPSGASLGLASTVLTLLDNEPSIGFSAAAYTTTEAPKSLVISVKRTGVLTSPVVVNYTTADGSATQGADYTTASGSLSFTAGVSTKTFAVPILGDSLDEPNETVLLTLSGAAGLGQSTASLTITDDDVAGQIELQAPTFSGGEAGGSALVTVKRSGGSAGGASVQYTTSNGTANAGSDYTTTSGTLSFAAGETTRTFSVPILNDGVPEATETLNVTLSAPGGGASLGPQSAAVVYVVSSDVLPTLSIDDVSQNEGNAGTANATFNVTLTPASSQTITVAFTTANGSATQPSDYTLTSGTLTFDPAETLQTVNVPIVGDTDSEGNETFFVNLSSPTNAAFGDAQGQGTILNDELPGLSINDVTVTEGNSGTSNATFTVTLSPPAAGSVTVQYATANGTATGATPTTQSFSNTAAITITDNAAGSPYPATLTVPALTGAVTKVTATLTGYGHTWPQDTDVLLVGPGGQKVILMSDVGGVGPGFANRNLTFDDSGASLPTSAFASGTYRPTDNEDGEPTGDSFPGPAPAAPYGNALSAFNGVNPAGTWSLYVLDDAAGDSGSITGGFSLSITTNGDYTPTSGTLTFSAGATNRTIPVPVVGELFTEADETFFVNLSGAVNATITDAQGLGTITNNDCSDSDSDRLCDSHETNTGVYVSPTNTGTDPGNADTDGDQLPDGDEVLGSLAGLDLPAMGTNPLKKNILLEYDWMNDSVGCGSHSHRPTQAIVDRVSAAFAASTVSNPDGSTGIVTIHDFGQGGAFTGGTMMTGTDVTGGVNGANFQSRKATHFAANRNGYFHYVILPHEYTDSPGSSGQAELPGDDLIVSMGCFGSFENTSNTIMHELGHNLLLRHGGFENCNWKPNYNSVMNYRFQFPGVDTSCNAVGSSGENNTLDYSRGTRISLDENNLNENQGSCGATAIDWNFVSGIQTGVVYDLNRTDEVPTSGSGVDNSGCAAALTTLTDSNDWASMVLTGLSDTDGRSLRPFEIIDCNNPWLARTRPQTE